MVQKKDNIVLIGMPGVGKSFIGKQFAKKFEYNFVDCDDIIKNSIGEELQSFLDNNGEEEFIKLEEKIVIENCKDFQKTVISPGGSVIYSHRAMKFLKQIAVIIYIKENLDSIKNRIKSYDNRGTLFYKELGFDGLYKQRARLYEKYCDKIVEFDIKNNLIDIDSSIKKISELINN